MENYSIYEDMSKRTGGEVYIGVVGPVRTGKSTFIKRFMEMLVLPYANESEKTVMLDELPQSSTGKTIMTTEPKFVPAKAAEIVTPSKATARVRLVDCVGYIVDGAVGFEEDGYPRLVKTSWSDVPIPFEEAATIGTERVIKEHSTVGVLVTTDGSFTPIERSAYEIAEARAAAELKAIGKPFIVVLNCVDTDACEELRGRLEEKYGVPVVAMNVEKMGETDALSVLQAALLEFPVRCVDISVPGWLQALSEDNPFVSELLDRLRSSALQWKKMKDCRLLCSAFEDGCDYLAPEEVDIDAGSGVASVFVGVKEGLFFRALSHECGVEIKDDCALMMRLKALAEDGREYEKLRSAWEAAEATGYGVVTPRVEELHLSRPVLVKKGANYGVRFRADGASYHIIKVGVGGQVEPIVGGKTQGEGFCQGLLDDYDADVEKVWETNVFGSSVRQLLEVELQGKNKTIPEELKGKIRRAISRIVNDGKGSFLCIIL